jgi:hypothetical protein
MKKHLLAYILVLFFASCEKDISTDKLENLDDQEWFKNLKSPCDENTVCKLRINKALYDSDTVFYSTYVGALCDQYFTVSLLNVNGDTIKSYSGPDKLETFNNEVGFIETIYRCEDN